jgi:uncharacterized membrane protein YkoI
MRTRAAALLAAALLVPCLATARGEETDWPRLLGQATLDLRTATERGLKEAGEGVVFHAELEEDEGRALYSIDVAQGQRTVNVVLDAAKGSVVEREVEEEDHSAAVKAARSTLVAAIEDALRKTSGRAVEAQLSLRDGKPVITVKVFGEGGLKVVRLDESSGDAAPESSFTDTFHVEPDEWASRGVNPFFVLEPGRVLLLEGKDDGEDARVTIRVLHETKTVAGVETRVVEEREEVGGRLVEVSRNYFALSKKTNDVYYFGEDVDVYEDGKVVRHDGSWLAGKDGARFGLMMPGTPLLGARHYQEIAPGVAMDRAEVVSLTEAIETIAGRFTDCLKVVETTPLEKDRSTKVYARGIGLVRDGGLRFAGVGWRK